MIVVIARLKAKKGLREDAVRASYESIEATRKEKGCISYELFASAENETDLAFVEKWEDADSLRAHLNTEQLKKAQDARAPFLSGPMDVQAFEAAPLSL
ncbi:MAG: antibiotic biosynthesis monooxygenase [Synergistaceae bacterium]|jgi:quinol monooxygenase YgiN|nr:antibiotic biosynthesis monooxygenase [Synergistaceae bacterium]